MKRGIGVIGIIVLLLAATAGLALAADEEKEMAAVKEKVSQVAQAALVRIHFEFQKDPEEGLPEDHSISSQISNKTTWDTSGIMVQPEGTVLIIDSMLERKFVKKITVVDSTGAEYEAELKSFLLNYPAAFLSIKGAKKPKGSVTFAEAGELNTSSKLYSAVLFKDNENWYMHVMPTGLSTNTPFEAAPATKPWFQIVPKGAGGGSLIETILSLAYTFGEGGKSALSHQSCALLFNDKGQPIGCPLEGRIEIGGDRYGWRGTDLMKSPSIACADFDKKIENTQKEYADYILETKFLFRQPEKDKAGSGSYSRYNFSFRGRGRDDEDEGLDITEKKLYGLAVSQTKILVPKELPKELINRIENIEVTINDKKYQASYLGTYEEFSGMLLELADSKAITKPMDVYKATKPELGRALLTMRVKDKFNKRYEKTHYDRFVGINKGYKNRTHYDTARSSENGTFFISFAGEPVGVLMAEKKELADKLSGDRGYGDISYVIGGLGGGALPYFFKDIKKYLTEPTSYFDKKLMPLSDREMKRIIWLGVEFQTLTKELAEQLNCQKITREGQLGLLVSHIHENSPAAKAGIKNTDILLKIKEEGKEEIELSGKGSYDYREIYSRYSGGDDDDFSGYTGSGMTPWPTASNYLNQILTQIGEDKKITLTYLRDGKEITQDFTLEKAPYDFESAEKYKDEITGLTIRELTYEVRHAWRLANDYKAIIVSKVEEGSKAAIGGIRTYELITKIDDQLVGSIADFKKIIETLTKDKAKEKARFTIERMGKSRFVDVELKKQDDKKD